MIAANPSSAKVRISVVIPTFNRERLVNRTIESVLNQTLKADQIIVVDDGSTDTTAEVCRKFANSIEYVRQANAGVSAARNHGIRLARHDWVAFLDSDDYWTPTHLEKMTAAIKGTSGRANFYFADMRIPDEADEMTLWSKIGFTFTKPFILNRDGTNWMLASRQPCSIQASVFNAARLRASGGFDQRFRVMEDTELFCRLGILARVCAVNTVGCVHTSDGQQNRLTATVHESTESYWRQTCLLWSKVRSQFPDLPPTHRRIIRFYLADGYWRLARFGMRTGRYPLSAGSLLKMMATYPPYMCGLILHRRSPRLERIDMFGFGDDFLADFRKNDARGVERVSEKSA